MPAAPAWMVTCRSSAYAGTSEAARTTAARESVANLVSSAVKFTLPGGTIKILGHRVEDEVEISVSDTGVGMPPGKVDDLFRLDRRTTTNGTAGAPGSGLGFLLCRDLVEEQGGVPSVRSAVDRGKTFRFLLPLFFAVTPARAAEAPRVG